MEFLDMADSSGRPASEEAPPSFRERRLALELERLKRAPPKSPPNIFGSPLTLTIVGGFLTLMTSTITSHLSSVQSTNAETMKARQALQAELIKKFIDNPDPKKVRANLNFLAKVGLIEDYAKNIEKFLKESSDSELPAYTNSNSFLQKIKTDDDAIDIVMKMEGGYVKESYGQFKFGIDKYALEKYFGRPVSDAELINLTEQDARAVYKSLYLAGEASKIASEKLKAAYMSLAVFSGRNKAVSFLLSGLKSIVNSAVISVESKLDSGALESINNTDPDLLIEAMNCEAGKYYRMRPNVQNVAFRRLRMFSPAKLKGMCPEVLAPSDG